MIRRQHINFGAFPQVGPHIDARTATTATKLWTNGN